MQHLLERWAFWVLMPLLAPQGLYVRARAPRFSPAAGPGEGEAGEGELFRLLAIGDSIVAGVGLERLESAVPAQLARALASRLERRVRWTAHGISGIGSSSVRQTLVPRVPDDGFDCVFVSVGVNDVTGLRSTRAWRTQLSGLIDDLHRRAPDALIVISGLPPIHGFPLLPQPLRAVMGMRARTFDRIAEDEVSAIRGALFVPNRFDPRPEQFAPDGYHPSAETCRAWGEIIAEHVARWLRESGRA